MSFALIGGTGALPGLLISRLEAAGTPPVLAELDGFAMEGRRARPVIHFCIETLGSLIAEFASRGVTQVCFAGALRRPALDPARIDAATLPLVPRIMQALEQGDDGALSVVIALFAEAGIEVVAAHDIAPDLLLPAGVPTRAQPDQRAKRNAARGQAVLDAMGAADIGQACVIAASQAVAIEAQPGTDWMLASLLKGDDFTLPKDALFMKGPKPGQDRRIDMPTIGVGTVTGAKAAGLTGLVIEAQGVLVLDSAGVIAACDAAGLFLWVRERA